MLLRFFLLVLVTVLCFTLLHGQDVFTFQNNPFDEVVRPVVQSEGGRVWLGLRNGFRDKVVLKSAVLTQEGRKPVSLFPSPTEIFSAETKYAEVDTQAFSPDGKITLLLDMMTPPPRQQPTFAFRFDKATGRIVETSPIRAARPGWHRARPVQGKARDTILR